jgi:hypothetical protein
MHADKSQVERTRALEDFKNGKIRVLVATDIAARGNVEQAVPRRDDGSGLFFGEAGHGCFLGAEGCL